MPMSFVSQALRRSAAAVLGLSLFAPATGAQTGFDALCAATPTLSFVTSSVDQEGGRFLYAFDQVTAVDGLTRLGEIPAPINAVGLYGGLMYGVDRYTAELHVVDADGSIVETRTVDGLPIRQFVGGATDVSTGTHYVLARNYAKAYAIDLDDPSAPVTRVYFKAGGVRQPVDAGDIAFYDGYLYGYDMVSESAFRVDVATDAIEYFAVPGLPAQMYPAVWATLDGTLMFYRSNAEVYEVSIAGAAWAVLQTLSGPDVERGQTDAASCPNLAFVDTDGDGVTDDVDNCVAVPNPAQMDLDGDGVGDQFNLDLDGFGDACDPVYDPAPGLVCDGIMRVKAELEAYLLANGSTSNLAAKLDSAHRKCVRGDYRGTLHQLENFDTQATNDITTGALTFGQATSLITREQLIADWLLANSATPRGGKLTAGAPAEVTIDRTFPNPVRDRGTVSFGLPTSGETTVTLYDVRGREVAVLQSGFAEAGWHEATLDAERLPAGLYLVRLQSDHGVATQKLTVVR